MEPCFPWHLDRVQGEKEGRPRHLHLELTRDYFLKDPLGFVFCLFLLNETNSLALRTEIMIQSRVVHRLATE